MSKFEVGDRVRLTELPWRLGTIKEQGSTMCPRYEVVWDDSACEVCEVDGHRLASADTADE